MTASTMRRRMAALLLGSNERARGELDSMLGEVAWQELVDHARGFKLVPQLLRRTRELGLEMPPAVAHGLEGWGTAAASHAGLVCHGARRAALALRDVGIDVAAIKGVAAIAYAGRVDGRMLGDADLLVRPDDLEAALVALAAIGFEPQSTIDLKQWRAVLAERVLPGHDYVVVADRHGVELDLHWRVDGVTCDVDALIAGAEWIGRGRLRIPVVARDDAALLTAAHSVRERFRPRVVIKDLWDQRRWLDGLIAGDGVSTRLTSLAAHEGLAATWAVLARFDPAVAEVPGLATAIALPTPQALADFFEFQLDHGDVSETVLGLCALDSGMVRRFFVSRWRRFVDRRPEAVMLRQDVEGNNISALIQLVRSLARLRPRYLESHRAMARCQRDAMTRGR